MVLRVFAVGLLLTFAPTSIDHIDAATPDTVPDTAPSTEPMVTFNEFLPEDVPIGDCISAMPKPDCGSKSRGGWHQYLVLIGLVGGMSFIGWRIVAGVRRPPPTPRV